MEMGTRVACDYMLRCFNCVWLFETPWTVVFQAPLSMGFSRQEYWSGWPFPPPGDLPDPRIEPLSLSLLHWQEDSLPDFPGGSDGKASVCLQCRRPGFDPWVGKIPWRRKWQSTPVLLPGKSHGQSLVGYSLWGHKESDTTERLH